MPKLTDEQYRAGLAGKHRDAMTAAIDLVPGQPPPGLTSGLGK